SAIVYTDIAKDGMMQGCNVPFTAALAAATRIPVIASGRAAWAVDVQHDSLDHWVSDCVTNLAPKLLIAGHRFAHADMAATADQHTADRN
ncbi:HisA/HisF-related TIM barrel protein, partial [Klebsiella pneumoniae]|uniref:HisA/HisF-related TIM barrel protein n=1 Tax=Klebsiella pneumoniae TaxID=573 RepID=UPI0039C3DAEF